MIKKYQKFLCVGICFIFFLCVSLFYLPINRACAAGLEVQYPTIAGQSIGAGIKLPDYVKYLFNAGMFIGFFAVFISLTIAGVIYFLSPINAGARADAKDRVSGAISGLLILALTYLIITTINPQLSILNSNELPSAPQPPVATKAPGVYFYNNASDCPDNPAQLNTTTSVSDLGGLKNKVNSINIIQNTNTNTSYVSILYNKTNLWGKCQYINPNQGCQTIDPFAASASVHIYDFSPNGDGVYFYRKSCFNKISNQLNGAASLVDYCNTNSGGYYKIPNSDISGSGGNIYVKNLEELSFTGDEGGDCNVPEEEQDCIKYDKNGNCTNDGRQCPTLGGKNISSIIINGNYLVLFVYFAPDDTPEGPWTSCQEFPTTDDVNKFGPEQMKWENIRNSGGVIPNYVIIIPIQDNSSTINNNGG
jgi:hypothetical protein